MNKEVVEALLKGGADVNTAVGMNKGRVIS